MDKGTHKEPSPSFLFHKHHIENHNESPNTNYTPIVIKKLNNTEDNPVVIDENYISETVYTETKARIKDNPIQKISIIDSDLRETFIKGRGPGGQKINKTNNCVQLLHIPTSIIINCQETRDLQSNRKIARKMLRDKLDLLLNGNQSKLGKRYDKIRKQKQQQIK
jgi:protein subunit release factor B